MTTPGDVQLLRAVGEGDLLLRDGEVLRSRSGLERALEHILQARAQRGAQLLRAAGEGNLLLRDGTVLHRCETASEHVPATARDTGIVRDLIIARVLRCAPSGVLSVPARPVRRCP